MSTFPIPTREDVAPANQAIFDQLKKGLGMVPNLYATFAHSDHALGNFLGFANGKTSLTAKQKEAIDLAVSEVNGCSYCLAAHTAIAKGAGISKEQSFELRRGTASFDSKLDALAAFARETAVRRGKPAQASINALLGVGFTRENIVDAVLAIGQITVTNYLHGITQVDVDFPAAQPLAEVREAVAA